MGQQAAPWRDEEDQQAWLSMLVAAMEEAACPDVRGMPCAGDILARLYAQLSHTVQERQAPAAAARATELQDH